MVIITVRHRLRLRRFLAARSAFSVMSAIPLHGSPRRLRGYRGGSWGARSCATTRRAQTRQAPRTGSNTSRLRALRSSSGFSPCRSSCALALPTSASSAGDVLGLLQVRRHRQHLHAGGPELLLPRLKAVPAPRHPDDVRAVVPRQLPRHLLPEPGRSARHEHPAPPKVHRLHGGGTWHCSVCAPLKTWVPRDPSHPTNSRCPDSPGLFTRGLIRRPWQP